MDKPDRSTLTETIQRSGTIDLIPWLEQGLISLVLSNNKILDISSNVQNSLLYQVEELQDRELKEIFAYPQGELLTKKLEQEEEFSAILRRKDQTELAVKVKILPKLDSETPVNLIHIRNLDRVRKSKEEMEKIILAMQDGFSVLSEKAIHLEANPAFCKMLGLTREELIGCGYPYPYWPPDKLKTLDKLLGRVAKGDYKDQLVDFIHKDGHAFPVIVSPSAVLDENGDLLYYFATYKDLSKRRQIEQRLEDEERKFKLLFSEMIQGLAYFRFIYDDSGKAVDAELEEINYAFLEITGLTQEMVKKIRISQLYTDSCRRFDDILAGTSDATEEYIDYYIEIDKYLKIKAAAVDENHMLVTIEDVSESKKAEEALKKSEEEARLLFNQSSVIMWEEDFSEAKIRYKKLKADESKYLKNSLQNSPEKLNEIINAVITLQINQAYKDYFKLNSKDEIPDILPNWFTPETLTFFQKGALAICEGANSYEGEMPMQTPEGESRFLYLRASVPEPYRQNLKKVLVSLIDITRQKLYEKSLEENQKELSQYKDQLEALVKMRTAELEETNKELQSFSYSVSHDLRAPLTRMDGFARAMQKTYEQVLDEKGMHYLSRIRASSQQMTSLINDLLMLSKINKLDLKKEKVNLGELAIQIFCELTEKEPQRKIKLSTEEELHANMEPGLAKLLLENLIGNAWKFSSKKEMAQIDFGKERRNGIEWFYVKDNGMGFNMKYGELLYTPFQRLHSSPEIEGSGIGLSTVKRIINKHGGQIKAEAEPDKGASFYFRV
ncbi:MAG: PAS domain S-box protein [Bacteroidia bacterium]|nr:PAS domain S-box protein [Bacteroidia bacterium]